MIFIAARCEHLVCWPAGCNALTPKERLSILIVRHCDSCLVLSVNLYRHTQGDPRSYASHAA